MAEKSKDSAQVSDQQGKSAMDTDAAVGGGLSTLGPAIHVPEEVEPGGLVPPYEGRQEHAKPTSGDEPAGGGGGGGGGMKETRELSSPKPEDTPGGRTTSPADEQPADETSQSQSDDEGVGPSHIKGSARGENVAKYP